MRLKVGFMVGAIAGLTLAGTAAVVADIPDSVTGVVTSCLKANGTIQVIDAEAGTTCGQNQTTLGWNQVGPIGPIGPEGPAGETGATGETGETGETGMQGESGVTVSASSLIPPYAWTAFNGRSVQDAVIGDLYDSAWAPYLAGGEELTPEGTIALNANRGWRIDSAALPGGTGMRVDALVNLETVQLDAAGSASDIQFCIRLADKNSGVILGSEVCIDQSEPGDLLSESDNGFGYVSKYHEKHITGPTVAVTGSELYLEYRLVTTPFGIPHPFGGSGLVPLAGSGNVFQPYLELV
jgi:hypothetical protein